MKKNIVIMTSEESFHNNYGAVLQGYALSKIIEELGFSSSIVRYIGGEFGSNQLKYRLYCIKRSIGRVYRILTTKRKTDSGLQRYENDIARRTKLFNEFKESNMTYWNEKRVNWQQLEKDYPIADYYLCGSDQIWNPYFKRNMNDPGYFLAFAPRKARKISYAPSFGADDIPLKAQKNLKELLSSFDAISVREKSGVDIVKKYAGRDAKWVLDPTLLRTPEQWKAIARMPANLPDKYILCYRFADSQHTAEMIQKTAEALDLPVVSMPLSSVALKDPFQFIFDVGPREFIGLIQNAALVCTDSFHATVFSILMKTPVAIFEREAYLNGKSMNSRIESLTNMLSLEHLIKRPDAPIQSIVTCMNEDYAAAHERLMIYRQESLEFLSNALQEE